MNAAGRHVGTSESPMALVMPRPPDGPSLASTPSPPTADCEAIRELWCRHGTALTQYALKLTLGDRSRAEDILQETLVRAWRHPEVVGIGQRVILPWLFTVARNVAIDMWRARSRSQEISIREQAVAQSDPVDRIEQLLTVLDVRAALAQLTPEHREVIVERYYDGQPVNDIARRLGIPVGTVKSRVHYGLRKLGRELSPYHAEAAARSAGIS